MTRIQVYPVHHATLRTGYGAGKTVRTSQNTIRTRISFHRARGLALLEGGGNVTSTFPGSRATARYVSASSYSLKPDLKHTCSYTFLPVDQFLPLLLPSLALDLQQNHLLPLSDSITPCYTIGKDHLQRQVDRARYNGVINIILIVIAFLSILSIDLVLLIIEGFISYFLIIIILYQSLALYKY